MNFAAIDACDVSASYRINYTARPRLKVYFAPQASYWLTSLYHKSSLIRVKPYGFGIEAGIKWRLK